MVKGNLAVDKLGELNAEVLKSLFITITNANFDAEAIRKQIIKMMVMRDTLGERVHGVELSDAATFDVQTPEDMLDKASDVGVLSTENEDIRSLRELITYGLKGMAAYTHHAYNIGKEDRDIYTHSEMLPAHYYPFFKKYDNFVGNYGGSWWRQVDEFGPFNGPILFTTNCIVPPRKDEIRDRIFTTGAAGFSGCGHIEPDEEGKKDFTAIIEMAKGLSSPEEIEIGSIVGGFAHNQVFELADKVVDAVKSGAIKKFFVMAGCDGRMKSREYYTEFARELPADTVILTAGCAKYRYNKLPLGDIGGIPRVLDAGQCNDSYSLAVIALKLKEIFELEDINDLPIAFNIAWYEQKAIIVLLALLSLGVKDIHAGPTLPGFLSPNVGKVLVEQFGMTSIKTVDEDIELFMA